MQKKMVLSIFVMISLFLGNNTFPITIHNDLQHLAEAADQYAGFMDAPVYVQGAYLPLFHTITIPHDPNGYVLEIEVPAQFAAKLAGKELSRISETFLSMLRCYLNIHFKPHDATQNTLSITEILIDKASKWERVAPTYTIRWHGLGGLRSITVYIQDNN